MDQRSVTSLRALAAILVFVTAAFHFWWGLPRALGYLQGLGFLLSQGIPPDPRPFLFVLFGLALFTGPYLVTRDVISLRRGYQLGVFVMLLSITAWTTWHLTDHLAFVFPGNERVASETTHVGVVATIVDHYVDEPIEGAIKTVELLAAMAFGALLRWDPAVRGGDSALDDERERTA